MAQFALTESEAHFMAHTRMLTKPRKNYDGKRKPKPTEEQPLPDTTTSKPKVRKKPFKFQCINCGQEYTDPVEHEFKCLHTINVTFECPICKEQVIDINQHQHAPSTSPILLANIKCPFCKVQVEDYDSHWCDQIELANMGDLALNFGIPGIGQVKLPPRGDPKQKKLTEFQWIKEELRRRNKKSESTE
jgi:hypothetical protein